jgi:hypothetical protein
MSEKRLTSPNITIKCMDERVDIFLNPHKKRAGTPTLFKPD